MAKKLTQKEFIERTKMVHGDKYDYSKVEYVNNSTPVYIICSKHGEFYQKPHDHLSGCGCKKCAIEHKKSIFRTSKSTFISKAKQVHGDKYDYSKIEYINNHTKVCIICPKHGEFWQTPENHLHYGCNKCGYESSKIKNREGIENIINRCTKTHGNKYDYSLVDKDIVSDKIKIICKKHGIFEQQALYHINGGGCPHCIKSALEEEIEKTLINNNISFKHKTHPKWLGKLELDFYLPEYNIAIECQGRQHYEAIDYFGGASKFDYTKKCDAHKQQLCKKNGVKLLYFTHYDKINEEGNIYKNKDKLLEEIIRNAEPV